MGLRRVAEVVAVALVLVASALWSAGVVKIEDWQFHVFPGGVSGPDTANVARFGATGDGATDDTAAIQAAIDSGLPELRFPRGTFDVCNLMIRGLNQHWIGAGAGQTILAATAGCNNSTTTSFGGVFSGPVFNLEIEGFTFQGAVQNALVIQCRDIAAHVLIHNNAFDTGGVGCPTNATGPGGISLVGCRDFVIRDNEFYSSCPGSGGKGISADGIRGGLIAGNRSNWQQTFIEIGTTANRPTEFTNITDNTYHGTFWGIPTKYTNSGGTVTYNATSMTDTAASFAGLCAGGGASPCAAAAGSFLRAMTVKASGNANFNTGGGMLTDGSANFTGAGVTRGDIIKTTPVCLGNGTKGQAARFVCTGGAGTGAWGDSCVCTANADCSSNICEPRWATVDTVASATILQPDEWVRETACPLGSAICASSSRRPTGAILTTGSVAYTVYGWTACQIASFTGTTVTCNTDNWFSWTGSAATPGAGTLYEIGWSRPLYFALIGTGSSPTANQGVRLVNNTVSGGFADHFELTGTRFVVADNHSRDCGDTCYVFAGDQFTVSNNLAEHCGARGMIALGNDQTWSTNIAIDSPWVRVSNTTTLGDINVQGSRNTFTGNKVKAELPVNLNRYGYVSIGSASGNSTENQFINNTCQGTYTGGCFRMDATGGTTTNNHFIGYHGETISNNGGTFFIEGGLATFAQVVTAALAPINGSYVGCQDCTPATPCVAGAGNGSILKRQGGAWNCP